MSVATLHALLAAPPAQLLLHAHPNTAAAPLFEPPDAWNDWWHNPPPALHLLDPDAHPHIPASLRALLSSIRALLPPRHQISLAPIIAQPCRGMSPKKHHEVACMTQFIADLPLPANLAIVDIGSGQAYLTRALHRHLHCPVLALDFDDAQTAAARSRDDSDAITYRTVHITPDTLLHAVDDWIAAIPSPAPVPVIFVALHACGSLTPSLLRAFLSTIRSPAATWTPAALVAVGCCYNLISNPSDFPLSHSLSSLSPDLVLPRSAFHLAAQIPAHWNDSPAALAAATLALRKVVWRALLVRLIGPSSDTDTRGTGSSLPMRRLGRLSDAAYKDWETFLGVASVRLGVDMAGVLSLTMRGRDPLLERQLEVLHVLRCLLGPLVEGLIVRDRVAWVDEQLRLGEADKGVERRHDQTGYEERKSGETEVEMRVEAVNLFDQATGSARNIAIVVAPRATNFETK